MNPGPKSLENGLESGVPVLDMPKPFAGLPGAPVPHYTEAEATAIVAALQSRLLVGAAAASFASKRRLSAGRAAAAFFRASVELVMFGMPDEGSAPSPESDPRD